MWEGFPFLSDNFICLPNFANQFSEDIMRKIDQANRLNSLLYVNSSPGSISTRMNWNEIKKKLYSILFPHQNYLFG